MNMAMPDARPAPLLPGPALMRTAELVSPRTMMGLPTWSHSSKMGVDSARPNMDLSCGSLHGQRMCTTWKERSRQIAAEDGCIARLSSASGELLTEQECTQLCERVRSLLEKEPNVVPVQAPVTIVGDVKGQFLDLLNLFSICGSAPETNYLFLGNYIARGYDSISTLCLLLELKARYPQRIALLRGNHEGSQITQVHRFYDECMQKYQRAGPAVWRTFCDCFKMLPLAAIVEGEVFCVHSGLSPSVDTLDQLRALDRRGDVPLEGPVCDLLWSDPDDRSGWSLMGRGVHFSFGEDITKGFLQTNGLGLMTRSHQLMMEGFQLAHDSKLATVWSAPNYCNRCGNQAAVVEFDEHMQRSVKQFDAVPWPSRSSEHGRLARGAPDCFGGEL